MNAPLDPKYYDKDEFHQGDVPIETIVSVHYSEVIQKLLDKIGKGDIEEIKKEVDRLLRTCEDQGNAIDYLKAKVFELENGRAPTDYDRYKYSQQSAAKKAVQTGSSGAAVWTRDKYGNVVKKPEFRAGPGYPKEFYQYHYGVPYNPRNPPSRPR